MIDFILAILLAIQPQPAVPDWNQSHLQEGDPAIRSLHILAVCARNHRRDAVEALLASSPGSEEEERLLRTVAPGRTECPIRTTRLTIRNQNLVRGAVAEAIYNGDRVRPRVESLPFTESLVVPPGHVPIFVGRHVSRCAVHRAPQLAHQVVSYNPGATGERRALFALRATFVACLPAGERLAVSRLMIRALIAEGLYHASRNFRGSFVNVGADASPRGSGGRG